MLNEKVHVLVFINYWIEKCKVKHWNLQICISFNILLRILLSSGMWCHKFFYKLNNILEYPEDISSWFLQDVIKYLSDYIKDSIFTVTSNPATFFYTLCNPNGKSKRYTTQMFLKLFLLYTNICTNKYCKFTLNYSDMFRC